ncbi:transketolase family protein [Variovorax fucosicus]|uniref:transketolase family protein n=1 Tax=Variovorax fucosicus TaxID=3053517 RepID=UPI002577AF96|nr:transketolase C-terminal domain-containing protein [Variovorax sp. J22G47]MDM0056075.1 transketolase C-terminal domain-containing protein [Variovorax sp. J22G47]
MSKDVQIPGSFDCRVAFADELTALAQQDPRIVAVCNDSVGSSNLVAFRAAFPDRVINVGIAEQNMVGVAAGLANGGYLPFVCAAAPFLTGRALEQIKADVAYSNFPVVLCGMSPGMAYGELGPTHHSIEDLPWMRAIANLAVLVPADPAETRSAMRAVVASGKPAYLRIGRHKVPAVTPPGAEFGIGKATILRDGNDIALIAIGTMVSRALAAADLLAEGGIQARVINAASVKPLDADVVLAAARETGRIVTVEEGIVYGGLGSAVAELVSQWHPVPMRIMGVSGFAPTGNTDFLLEHFGLTAAGIVHRASELVAREH